MATRGSFMVPFEPFGRFGDFEYLVISSIFGNSLQFDFSKKFRKTCIPSAMGLGLYTYTGWVSKIFTLSKFYIAIL